MMCEICHGEGVIHPTTVRDGFPVRPELYEPVPCPDCGGQRFQHCCDGLKAQPKPEEK
jgi:hypothetical protein